MAKFTIDLSGRRGLATNFFGDLNDTTAKPHLRYLGSEGQFADGIYNPFKLYGYLSPANNTFASLTGALNATIIATEYDSINDDMYLAEEGAVIWRLDGLDDTSLTADTTVNQSGTETLNDLNIYEINGSRALFYTYKLEGTRTDLGYVGLDATSGASFLDNIDGDNTTEKGVVTGGGSTQAIAQSYVQSTAFSFDRVILPVTRIATDNGGYTIQVDVQKDAWTGNTASALFNGTDEYYSVNDNAALNLDSLTIEAWILVTGGGVQNIVAQADLTDNTNIAYRLYYQSDTGDMKVDLGTATETFTITQAVTNVANQWAHVAVTRDSVTGDVKFYINAEQVGTTQTSTTDALQDSGLPLVIGAAHDSSVSTHVQFFNGNIKEVRIWNDVRTASEIKDNYKTTLVGNESGLVAYYQMNGASGTDSTSNNLDLTASETPTTSTSVPPGYPDGVSLGTATGTLSDLGADGAIEDLSLVTFDFSSTISISASEKFFIILEPSSFGDMGAEDEFHWLGRSSDSITNGYIATYDGTDWATTDNDSDLDLMINLRSSQTYGSSVLASSTSFSPDADVFMVNADNGFMYIFEDNKVHKLDGGDTGGLRGTFNELVLRFPAYFKITDAIDTRGRMYIAVQANPLSDDSDVRAYSEGTCGIYLWDRLSTIVGTRDFLPLYGVRDIKKLYITPQGDVRAICIGDDRFVQIRSISNNGKIIERLGMSAYPEKRDSLKTMGEATVWLGADGVYYAHGQVAPNEPEALYKIGSINPTGAFSTGAIFVGDSESTQSRQAIVASFTDTADDKLVRWYPHGTGTIDAAAQLAHSGSVFTMLTPLPSLSNVRYINIFGAPTSTDNTDDIANVKIYFNQSSTPWATKVVTKAQMKKGWYEIPVNKQNVNFIQIEIEWATDETIGADTFYPMYAEVEVEDVESAARQKN